MYIQKNDLCYLYGSLLGDGCLYVGKNAYQFSITAEDFDFCDLCRSITFDIFGKNGKVKTIYKDDKISYYQLVVCSKKILYSLIEATDNKSKIPDLVYTDKETMRCFSQGLMDSDGWISRVNASDGYIRYRVGFKNIAEWTEFFRLILSDLQVRTGKLRKTDNSRYAKPTKPAYCFTINTEDFCKKVGFRINRKNNLVKDYYDHQSKKK